MHKAEGHVILKISVFSRLLDKKSWFVLQTEDTGQYFEPMFEERTPVDTNQHVSERAIGGLGLFLIYESVDKVDYERRDRKNIYELWMLRSNSTE